MARGLEASSLATFGFVFSKEGEGHGKGGFVPLGRAPGRVLLARITDKVVDPISLQSPVGGKCLWVARSQSRGLDPAHPAGSLFLEKTDHGGWQTL